MEFKRHLITAALPYANGPVHIGHLAGNFLPADIYTRFLRAKKEDVKFICGTDEHGVPITIRAMKEGVTPQDIVDKFHTIINDSLKEMASGCADDEQRMDCRTVFVPLHVIVGKLSPISNSLYRGLPDP